MDSQTISLDVLVNHSGIVEHASGKLMKEPSNRTHLSLLEALVNQYGNPVLDGDRVQWAYGDYQITYEMKRREFIGPNDAKYSCLLSFEDKKGIIGKVLLDISTSPDSVDFSSSLVGPLFVSDNPESPYIKLGINNLLKKISSQKTANSDLYDPVIAGLSYGGELREFYSNEELDSISRVTGKLIMDDRWRILEILTKKFGKPVESEDGLRWKSEQYELSLKKDASFHTEVCSDSSVFTLCIRGFKQETDIVWLNMYQSDNDLIIEAMKYPLDDLDDDLDDDLYGNLDRISEKIYNLSEKWKKFRLVNDFEIFSGEYEWLNDYEAEFNALGLLKIKDVGSLVEIIDDSLQAVYPKSSSIYEDVLGKLLMRGIPEEHAYVIAEHFTDIVQTGIVGKGQDYAYILKDFYGYQKVVKFATDQQKAFAEAKAMYHLSEHPVLLHYVPKTQTEHPDIIENGAMTYYLIVQDFKHHTGLDALFRRGSRHGVDVYLKYWMRITARLHVYGTQIMNDIHYENKALSLYKEKDNERINICNKIIPLVPSSNLRRILVQMDLEDRNAFIHQDLRKENRIGQYAIDWGHSGRGNPLLDIVRILSDYDVHRNGRLSDSDLKKYIAAYISEKRILLGDRRKISNTEMDMAFAEFNAIRLLYFQAQSAYQFSRFSSLNGNERKTLEYQTKMIPIITKRLITDKFTDSRTIWTKEEEQKDSYYQPVFFAA